MPTLMLLIPLGDMVLLPVLARQRLMLLLALWPLTLPYLSVVVVVGVCVCVWPELLVGVRVGGFGEPTGADLDSCRVRDEERSGRYLWRSVAFYPSD
jgi:hypothetical protein